LEKYKGKQESRGLHRKLSIKRINEGSGKISATKKNGTTTKE
jgi:hypothetical protein